MRPCAANHSSPINPTVEQGLAARPGQQVVSKQCPGRSRARYCLAFRQRRIRRPRCLERLRCAHPSPSPSKTRVTKILCRGRAVSPKWRTLGIAPRAQTSAKRKAAVHTVIAATNAETNARSFLWSITDASHQPSYVRIPMVATSDPLVLGHPIDDCCDPDHTADGAVAAQRHGRAADQATGCGLI